MKINFITGISGSGKTTVARALCKLGYIAFDSKINKGIFHFTDAYGKKPDDYQLNNEIWRKRFKWVLNKPMFDDLIEKNKDSKVIFLSGTGNIIRYRKLADKMFLLKVDEQTILNRLNDPSRDNQFGKTKETQNSIVSKLTWIQDSLIKTGAIAIDATQPVDLVVKSILSQISFQKL